MINMFRKTSIVYIFYSFFCLLDHLCVYLTMCFKLIIVMNTSQWPYFSVWQRTPCFLSNELLLQTVDDPLHPNKVPSTFEWERQIYSTTPHFHIWQKKGLFYGMPPKEPVGNLMGSNGCFGDFVIPNRSIQSDIQFCGFLQRIPVHMYSSGTTSAS